MAIAAITPQYLSQCTLKDFGGSSANWTNSFIWADPRGRGGGALRQEDPSRELRATCLLSLGRAKPAGHGHERASALVLVELRLIAARRRLVRVLPALDRGSLS